MNPQERIETINKADEIVLFSKKIFSDKRSELLRKAALLYRKATLSILADLLEKEAADWDENSNYIS
jgi:hypothetical protein